MEKYKFKQNNITKLPGSLVAYWMDEAFINMFLNNGELGKNYDLNCGIKTGNNDTFLRIWHEVSMSKVCLKPEEINNRSGYKWFLYNKGGGFQKWFGGYEYVINFANNGYDIKQKVSKDTYRLRDPDNYFKKAIIWPLIGDVRFSARIMPSCVLPDVACNAIFSNDLELLGYMNSKPFNEAMKFINSTVSYPIDSVASVPFKKIQNSEIRELCTENINISEQDFNSYETSWGYKKHSLTGGICMGRLLSEKFEDYKKRTVERFSKLKENEEKLNQIYIDIYGLNGQLKPDVDDGDISVRIASLEDEIKSLISYLIGIEMGRYSLDVEGLAYAGGDWNPMNYVTYQPDDDGIIPVYPQLGMADGLTARIIKLIKHIYGEDTYKENIDFIADALGKKNSESSEETLNRYLNEGFYADHLKTYQKRPIYWMFSSGKNDAFKCLVYLHRYNEDTLARINSKYFLNESARLNAEVNDTAAQLEAADGREKLRLDKLYKTLSAKQKEMLEYGWVLDHMANQYIPLDLDDGVKVNYAKFQGIEIVNDNGAKVKKDLLVPIK